MSHHESKRHNTNNNNYDNSNNTTTDTSTNSNTIINTIVVRCMIKKIETYTFIDYSAQQKGKMWSVGSIRVH